MTLFHKIHKCLLCVRTSRQIPVASIYGGQQDSQSKPYTPRRAVMYVPGNDQKKIQKVTSLDLDCAVLDCEDGVAANKKEEARSTIRQALDQVNFGYTECIVRVNSVTSGLMEKDLTEVLKAERMPHALMLPKVERPEDIDMFTKRLKEALQGRPLSTRPFLITYVESALGLMNLRDIFKKTIDLQLKEQLYVLDGVVFGSDDFCADIGATRTSDAKELLYARQKIVTCAKAFKLQAIDMVHIDLKDLEGIEKQSLEGARMGFTGKQVIHPSHIPIVQRAFSPTADQVKWATELVEAFSKHTDSGKGAFSFQGKMIDMPSVLQAKNILQLSTNVSSRTS
ncbi:citramalyl-CoA lyase, mitochondrial-like isoform X2 [Ostrea edulis]|uniref:citramalyl-CoA lyase, mitochondrial-like isoform X2 n=1 Tax=Ostrea edulis TaxID=37623 RepID=UPI0024AEF6AA|nr:citramalyl-CoA lyase, mitochondrial-like isoform X2 [Ostrea edulis]XP_048769198.2 citramalyl-CoA lyase, mitochondrial-like isoform X2 [Ostrea edulis]